MLRKRPAQWNIGIDLDGEAINQVAAELLSSGHIVSVDDASVPSFPAMKARTGIKGDVDHTGINGDMDHTSINGDEGLRKSPSFPAMKARTGINGDVDHTSINGDMAGGYELFTMDCLDFLEDYPFTGNEFVYADPPYVREARRSPRALYRYEYTTADHVRLLTQLRQLPCSAMVSGYWSDLYGDMLSGWRTYTFDAQTRSGKVAAEWLWMNYKQPVALHDYRYLGIDYRERERIKRKKTRWVGRLVGMDELERRAIMWALREAKFI